MQTSEVLSFCLAILPRFFLDKGENNMHSNVLVDALVGFGARGFAPEKTEINVIAAQLMCSMYQLLDGTVYCNPRFLFVGYVSELPKFLDDSPKYGVYIEDLPLPPEYTVYNGKLVIVVDGKSDLLQLFNCIVFNLADDIRLINGQNLLARMRSERQGLGMLTATIYEFLLNPVVVISSSYRVISKSSKCLFSDESVNRCVREGVFTREIFDRIRSEEIMHTLQPRDYFRMTFTIHPGRMWVVLPVSVNGFTVAFIIMQNYSSPIFGSGFSLMKQIGSLFSESIQNDPSIILDKGLMHSALFSELLSGVSLDKSNIEYRMNDLGWMFTDSMFLLCVSGIKISEEKRAVSLYTAIKKDFSNCRWIAFENDLIFLLNIKSELLAEAKQTIHGILFADDLCGGLSWGFSDVLSVRRNYLLAKKAVELGKRFNHNNTLYAYSDYYLHHMAQVIGESASAANCLHPVVMKLAEYDAAHNSGLLETLELYIHNNKIPENVSDILFISRSAAFWRLNKIKELCSLDLDSGEERAQILLSISILHQKEF